MWKSAAPPQSKSVLAVENTLFLLAGAHVGKNSVNVELGDGVLAFVALGQKEKKAFHLYRFSPKGMKNGELCVNLKNASCNESIYPWNSPYVDSRLQLL